MGGEGVVTRAARRAHGRAAGTQLLPKGGQGAAPAALDNQGCNKASSGWQWMDLDDLDSGGWGEERKGRDRVSEVRRERERREWPPRTANLNRAAAGRRWPARTLS